MAPGSEATTEVIAVEVPGGHLAAEYVTAGPGSARPVLAIHGISSQRKLWKRLRAARPGWLAVPTRLLTAQWSTGRDTPPAYPPEAVGRFQKELKTLATVKTVPGIDHAASIMSPVGARATAELLSEAL